MMVFDRYVRYVLQLAEKQKGKTQDNPVTASIILRALPQELYARGTILSHVIGKGIHQGAGLPHAEALAIQHVKETRGEAALKGATLIVNLEPCTHEGRMPPCTDAIIQSGIKTVVYAVNDPDARVRQLPASEALAAHGVRVIGPVSSLKGALVNDVFFKAKKSEFPFVILKAGISLDGRIALGNYVSQFITGENARRDDHKLRREVDAILIGHGTAKHDNPMLNVRYNLLKKGYRNPSVIVLDTHGRVSESLRLFSDKNRTCYIVGKQPPKWLTPDMTHIVHIPLDSKDPSFWPLLLKALKHRGILSVLIEGGRGIYSSAIDAGIVDKCVFYIAPKILAGNDDILVFSGKNRLTLSDCFSLQHVTVSSCEPDIKVTGYLNTDFL